MENHLLLTGFRNYRVERVNDFITRSAIDLRAHLIAVQGHAAFHLHGLAITAQLGSGACIAVDTTLPVVSDLRSMDLAFGRQGMAIAAICQKILTSLRNSVPFPETLLIALIGELRWREEANLLSNATSARQSSIGGALWLETAA